MSDRSNRIVIVGAGPAGSSLAIRLAEKGFSVVLIEREKFPRHKLCGEFISPGCLDHFRVLGVLDDMLDAGGTEIKQTKFYEPGGRSINIPSDWIGGGPALGLSRAEMDHRLMQRAERAGVEVLEGTPVTGIDIDKGTAAALTVRSPAGENVTIAGEIFVDATGRSKILSKLAGRKTGKKTASASAALVGFKCHLRNAGPEPKTCEIYSFRDGYSGLSTIEKGLANHCFLIRSEAVKRLGGDADRIVAELVYRNSRAKAALENSERVGDWLAVSVEGFGRMDLNPVSNVFSAGDSAAFIDPFTGSGMLMALESSELLARSIENSIHDPAGIAADYERRFRVSFNRRMRVSGILRRAAFMPRLAKFAIISLGCSDRVRETLARSTRNGRHE